jgi:hypothetical protein
MRSLKKPILFCTLALLAVFASVRPADAATDTLKIYLLSGQSNMEGQGYTWDNFATVNTWNVPTMEYLLASQPYFDSLPDNVYGFKQAFGPHWMNAARDDSWSVYYDSTNGQNQAVRNVQDLTPGDFSTPVYPTGIQPLSVGFGKPGKIGGPTDGLSPSYFGLELGMGHYLGEAIQSPTLLFKSSKGGTTLGVDWRPPSAAVRNPASPTGKHYTNTINRFKQTLDQLDADKTNGQLAAKYGGATDYEVAGLIWMQGWNEKYSDGPFTSEQMIAEYALNLKDLVDDIRASDSRIPADMPALIVESADQLDALNAQRIAGVAAINAETPGTAAFLEMNGLIGENYGGLNPFGVPYSNGYGSHFHVRGENYLEIGWCVGEAVKENGFIGSEVPEPSTSVMLLTAVGLCLLLWRRRGQVRFAA